MGTASDCLITYSFLYAINWLRYATLHVYCTDYLGIIIANVFQVLELSYQINHNEV